MRGWTTHRAQCSIQEDEDHGNGSHTFGSSLVFGEQPSPRCEDWPPLLPSVKQLTSDLGQLAPVRFANDPTTCVDRDHPRGTSCNGVPSRLFLRFDRGGHTPKHGSWLNVAEVELNVMIRQCLNRRIDSIDTLRAEVAAWQAARDRIQAKVDWQFTTDDARVKLKRLYPTFDV